MIQLFSLLNYIFLGGCTLHHMGTVTTTASSTIFLNNLLPLDYPKSHPPVRNRTDEEKTVLEPAYVYFRLRPEYITTISMKDMEFSVDMWVRVEWCDHRLNLEQAKKFIKGSSDLPRHVEENLWRPSMRFENLKGNDERIVLPELIKISSLSSKLPLIGGQIGLKVYYRKTLRFKCNLNFAAYPFDVQNCEIIVSYKTKCQPFEPIVTLFKTGVTNDEIPVPPGFRLRKVYFKDYANVTRQKLRETWINMEKSLVFELHRVFAQHIMLIFLPSILVVMLSWLSFWLDANTAAPRIALGLTTLLTLSTQFTAAQKDLPPVADVKALDIWMFCCIFMVFASLVEFGIAHLMAKRKSPKVKKVNLVHQYVHTFNKPDELYDESALRSDFKKKAPFLQKLRDNSLCSKIVQSQGKTLQVDHVARIAFPVAFLIFNIVFWCHYV